MDTITKSGNVTLIRLVGKRPEHPVKEKQSIVTAVFKTHLDIGYTDLAERVIRNYVESFIPKALDLAERCRRESGPVRFVWTTGSWLIHHYLEVAGSAGRRRMEAAIAARDFSWHALPFTFHTELCDAPLYRAGLSISRRLDARFGRKTISAKATDVPGHTRGIVPLLAEAGVQFLHIGVNDASAMPTVPPLFRWRAGSNEIVVGYNGNYGADITAPNGEVLRFCHSYDNQGPQSYNEIKQAFEAFAKQWPGKRIVAGTMDDFRRRIDPVVSELPVVEQEIGDTWIYGIMSDPAKVARLNHLKRLRQGWVTSGKLTEEQLARFDEQLLLVPEHTWGLDNKSFLGDPWNYANADFDAARKKDMVDLPLMPGAEWVSVWWDYERNRHTGRRYSLLEQSWNEQRGYIDQAIAELPEELRKYAQLPSMPKRKAIARASTAVGATWQINNWILSFNSLGQIIDCWSGDQALADADHPLAGLRYVRHDQIDYNVFRKRYHRPFVGSDWAEADFCKPGLGATGLRHAEWSPRLVGIDTSSDGIVAELEFDREAVEEAGAPRHVQLTIRSHDQQLLLELCWHDKRATRLPEALWMQFNPPADAQPQWQLSKLGHTIDPLEVVAGGSRMLHAIEQASWLRNGRRLAIKPEDSPLISVQGTNILQFPQEIPTMSDGIWLNLWNNLWGTNFCAWIEGNGRSRIRIG